jgi:deoxyribonuclease-1
MRKLSRHRTVLLAALAAVSISGCFSTPLSRGLAPGGGVASPVPSASPIAAGNRRIHGFREAKKIAAGLHAARGLTLYCRCRYAGKRVDWKSCSYRDAGNPERAARIEWEHVVPAESFGQSFVEWREGAPECRTKRKSYRGRRCAEKNPEFNLMEADLYNLFPEVGEVNALRSNYSMAEVGALGSFSGTTFGGCGARVFASKFEPMDFAKGTVARAYLYMDGAYPGHGIVSSKNRKLFEAWDAAHPVEPWECELYRRIRGIQGNENPILAERCRPAPVAAPATASPSSRPE